MISFISYILFLLTVSFASAGIVLSSRLRNKNKSGVFSSLMYFQVFIFTFGFYGIWGQLVVKAFLTSYVSPEAITRFTDISILLGLPFLVFGWLMLLRFSMEASGKKCSNWFIFWFLLLNFLFLLSAGYMISTKPEMKPLWIVRNYFIILNFSYSSLAAIIILLPGKSRPVLKIPENRITAFFLVILMFVQCVTLFFYKDEPVIGMIFIFLFFAGNAFLPVYMSYGITTTIIREEITTDITFDDFCKRFEVSARESDIIREICNGHSNKEISDKLFISLQTVKDHTHRIYIKTNVRSRAQLMNMINGVRGVST